MGLHMGHGGRFRHAEAFHQLAAAQRLELLLDVQQQRRRAGHAHPDRSQIVLANLRVIIQGVVHARHAGENRRAVRVNRVQHRIQIARIGHQHRRRRHLHRRRHAHHHAVHVEQRNGRQHDLLAFLAVRQPRPNLQRVRHQVAVQRHGGLGHARRPARILEQRLVVGRHRHFGPLRRQVLLQHVLERQMPRRQRHLIAALLLLRQAEQNPSSGLI